MNRFRGKKKNKDDTSSSRPSMESESSGPFRMFGKKKSQEGEPKREIDLTTVLPPTDDFRTSLLMTGLSARFSMLREQDDPKSKLGKASDDSVLFPKRQSRLTDFGGAGLHDIAEIESIRARQFTRVDSCISSDDAASTTGSVMHRAKPTEGNNLFGGRQKIYKIPAGSSSKIGSGMSGRALYDDDVAMSAFQRWRQAEKGRLSLEDDENNDTIESQLQLDYNRRRETNSTTSSAPSAARNSTAATSVTSSQPTSSVKDWQSAGAATGFAGQATALERNVTRTRRLYEQGLTQDLQDHQTSALSRMDNLSRQRPFGSRTPDLTPPVPSPTNAGFGDRVLERRPIIGKASAPNLRSFSPTTTSTAQMRSAEASSKFPRPDPKSNFGGSPPLSPPISETEDHPTLPIQPNDRGKATAMGVFNRPTQQYDESKYAQRQRQLQQGRETPTSQVSPQPDALAQGTRSRSYSGQNITLEKVASSVAASGPAAQKDSPNPTLFDDSDDASADNRSSMPPITPQLTIERPDDDGHPAFRRSALPTPLSLSSPKLSDEGGALSGAETEPPEDSPALGPGSGLSGMVRQHLRHESAASSTYGSVDQEPAPETLDGATRKVLGMPGLNLAAGNTDTANHATKSHDATPKESDEFARHLADGARRVRERLTTYVESDYERSAPAALPSEPAKEVGTLRPNALGILRSKSSRGSLFDREIREPGRSKSMKAQGTGTSDAAASSYSRMPSANTDDDTLGGSHFSGEEQPGDRESPSTGKDDSVHAGLKAFRQARRELQKMKELETQQRHQTAQMVPERTPQRAIPQDGGPPSAMFNHISRDDFGSSSRSRTGFRGASERDRSGSETSSGGQTYSRGLRVRNGSVSCDEQHSHDRVGGATQRSPSGRVAGFPGADIRQSPAHPTSPRAFPTGMPPSRSAGAIDPAGRRMVRKREAPGLNFGSPVVQGGGTQHDTQAYPRSGNGGKLSAAVSTPNLRTAASMAPPLPPINPRRRNGQGGFARTGEEGMPRGPFHVPLGGTEHVHGAATMADEEGLPDMYHQGSRMMTSDSHGRTWRSPPRGTVRPPLPYPNMQDGGIPGGMI